MAESAHIKNPLSIIGIFAGLVEVIGIGTLPLLHVDIQSVYIWFLMFFPTLLVGAFFYTLIYHPKSLYAPGDFQHDASWLATHFPPATANQIEQKMRFEIAAERQIAAESSVEILETPPVAAVNATLPPLRAEASGGLSLREPDNGTAFLEQVEGEVIKLIEQERGLEFKRNLHHDGNPPMVIDGMAAKGDQVVMIEVRFSASGTLPLDTIRKYLDRANIVYGVLTEMRKEKFEFIMAIAYQRPDTLPSMKTTASLARFEKEASRYPFKSTLRRINVDQLSIYPAESSL
nr:hypothetical protein [uncultured Albidiferax sp.]